jgi:hypothetical protein
MRQFLWLNKTSVYRAALPGVLILTEGITVFMGQDLAIVMWLRYKKNYFCASNLEIHTIPLVL